MSLSINEFKVYMPAKNFEQSKRFYAALGFAMSEGWGGTADFELNGCRFRLQDYYVKDRAENFMVSSGSMTSRPGISCRGRLPAVVNSTTSASSCRKPSTTRLFSTRSIHPVCCLSSSNRFSI